MTLITASPEVEPTLTTLTLSVIPSSRIKATQPVQDLVRWLGRNWRCDRNTRLYPPERAEVLKGKGLRSTRASLLLDIERRKRNPSGPVVIRELNTRQRLDLRYDEALPTARTLRESLAGALGEVKESLEQLVQLPACH